MDPVLRAREEDHAASGTTTPLEGEHTNAPTRCQPSSPSCARPGRPAAATGGFTALRNAVLLAPGLSRAARFLYAVPLDHARQDGRCFPSHATLAAALGAGETMVRAYLRELLDAGLVTQRRRGQGKTNVYRLCGPNNAEGIERMLQRGKMAHPAPGNWRGEPTPPGNTGMKGAEICHKDSLWRHPT